MGSPVDQTGLFEDAAYGPEREVFPGMRDGHLARLDRVFKVMMSTHHTNLNPPIGLDSPDQFAAVHLRIAAHPTVQVKLPSFAISP